MEKNRGTAVAVIAALVISVISLGVAFATFSQTLNINGTATVQASTWDIHFSGASDGSTVGGTISGSASNTTGATATSADEGNTLTGTDFTWSASFKSPGDRVQYHFYVANEGNYNARISNVITPAVTCTTGSNPTSPETTYCNKITYTVSYDAAGNQPVGQNDTLDAGEEKDIYVTATLTDYTTGDNAINTPPSSEITVNATPIAIIYQQVGTAVSGQ